MFTSSNVGSELSPDDSHAVNYKAMKNGNYGDTTIDVPDNAIPGSRSSVPFDIMNDKSTTTDGLQHGQQQQHYHSCDVIWSIVFLTQLAVIIVASIILIPQMLRIESEEQRRETSDDDTYNVYYDRSESYLYSIMMPYFGVCCILNIFLISLFSKLLMSLADRLIQFSLFFNLSIMTLYILLAAQFGVAEELLPIPMPDYGTVVVLSLVLWIFISFVAFRGRRRIPIATQTIIAAMTMVRNNIGTLSFYAYSSFLLTCAFVVLLFKLCIAIFTVREEKYCSDNGPCTGRFWFNGYEYLLVLFILYWTPKVLTNIIHVTTADMVGKLCLSPMDVDASGFKHLKRATTTSFGSICMGSVLVAFVRLWRNFILCVQYCSCSFFDDCVDPIMSHSGIISRWAYISMGVHGYRIMEGGIHSVAIFRDRGYTTSIPDQADTLLFMVDLSVGFLSALYFAPMAILSWDAEDTAPVIMAFAVIPFFLGTLMSMTFFSMIGVAVKTVTLCYLEFPDEFQKNHPQLYELMNDAWRREYPAGLAHQ